MDDINIEKATEGSEDQEASSEQAQDTEVVESTETTEQEEPKGSTTALETQETQETVETQESEESVDASPSSEQPILENQEPTFAPKTSSKPILIGIGVIFGLLILFFIGFSTYNHLTAAQVVTLDDMHNANIQGDLQDEEGYIYNGFSVIAAEGLWWTDVYTGERLIKIPLHFGPRDVEEIPVVGKLGSDFNKGKDIFVTINPHTEDKFYTLAITELGFNVAQGINRRPVGACTEEHEACVNRTIVSCDNTGGNPVIELELANESQLEYKGSCIKISGNDYDLIKVVDRLLYSWYGVMS